MASFLAEKGIRVGAPSGGRARKRTGTGGGAAGGGRRLRLAADPSQKFFRRIGILRIGFVAPRLPNLGHRAAHCFDKLARNLRQEPRRQGSAKLLLVPKDAAI